MKFMSNMISRLARPRGQADQAMVSRSLPINAKMIFMSNLLVSKISKSVQSTKLKGGGSIVRTPSAKRFCHIKFNVNPPRNYLSC